jgi:hypothetical protein
VMIMQCVLTFTEYTRFNQIRKLVLKLMASKLCGLNLRANYTERATDRRFSAKLVPNFADGGCHVVSVTDPYGRILNFSDWKVNRIKQNKVISEPRIF